MLPIILDGTAVPMALVGAGPELTKRLRWLVEGGARHLTVYAPDAPAPLALPDGVTGHHRLPTVGEIAARRVLWVCGLDERTSARLAEAARSAGTLVNVEDVLRDCDFHTPAVVRRGDLLLTVSTGGRSPGMAQRVRLWLEEQFGPEWAGRLETVGRKRDAWRRRQRSLAELATLTSATIDHQGWLERRPNEERAP